MTLLISLIMSIMITNKSPFSLVMILILITSIISIKVTMTSSVSWFGIMLFMSLVGGLMILFISIASASKNKKPMKINPLLFLMLIFLFTETKMKNDYLMTNNYLMSFNMSILLFISLNIILFFISKMLFSPNKPFKSNNYMDKLQ